MKGTKEFYSIRDSFERFIKSENCTAYFPVNPIKDRCSNDERTFYNNGKLNEAFEIFMSGYMLGRAEYMS